MPHDPAPAAEPPHSLAGHGAALVVVRLDESCDGWTASMIDGLRREAGPGADLRVWAPGMEADALTGVEAVFCWDPPPGLLPGLLPGLRLVASMGAGYDHMLAACAELPPACGVSFCRTVDPQAASRLAEWVLCAVVNITRRTEDFMALQAARQWNAPGGGLLCRDAADTEVGVIGLGEMGSAAAAALARHGFQARPRAAQAGCGPPVRATAAGRRHRGRGFCFPARSPPGAAARRRTASRPPACASSPAPRSWARSSAASRFWWSSFPAARTPPPSWTRACWRSCRAAPRW